VKKTDRVVVSDSTPLIYLAKIGRLDVIKNVFGEILIPEAVFCEAVTQGKALNMSDASIIEMAVGCLDHKGTDSTRGGGSIPISRLKHKVGFRGERGSQALQATKRWIFRRR
jgi:hypothetical protein